MLRHLVAALLLAASAALPAHSTPAAKPNILFVIADDLTFRDIGCYGGQAHTPHSMLSGNAEYKAWARENKPKR